MDNIQSDKLLKQATNALKQSSAAMKAGKKLELDIKKAKGK